MSDSITHRVGIDPATGDVISNPLLVDEALTIPRGAIYDRDGVALARTVFADGVARRVYPEPATAEITGYFSPLLYGSSGLEASWDDELAGRSGGNPFVRALESLRGLPRQGIDLHLTLDTDLQRQAHDALGERTGRGRAARYRDRRGAGAGVFAVVRRQRAGGGDGGRPRTGASGLRGADVGSARAARATRHLGALPTGLDLQDDHRGGRDRHRRGPARHASTRMRAS